MFKYMNTNLQLYSLTQLIMLYYLFIQLATTFGLTNNHQANTQKLKILTMLKVLKIFKF